MPPSAHKTARKAANVVENLPKKKNKVGPGRPPKKNKSNSRKYFFFRMKGNMKDAFISGEVAASVHRKDFEGYILQEKTFSKKGEFDTFKKQIENPALNLPLVTNKINQIGSVQELHLCYHSS